MENVNTPAALTLVGQLRARGIDAYTAGVIAMGTFSEFYLLRDHLPDSGTRTVVLGFYLGNDFHDNYWGNFIEGEEARAMPAWITFRQEEFRFEPDRWCRDTGLQYLAGVPLGTRRGVRWPT